jgi:hypothetical protein
MDILNKPINTFTFADVVTFCQEGHREGIQIDYKRDLPSGGLSKFFAAFSNTRGGVIIIGVEENRATGVPTAWVGVNNNAQSIERIHQWASNVEPLPSYDVHITDEQGGKVFILVRIFEGDRTPYYVQNDADLWVRTGNITSLVDKASPDQTELLVGKKIKAQKVRENNLNRAHEIYEAALKRAEEERIRLDVQEKERLRRQEESGNTEVAFPSRIYQSKLGSQTSMCTIVVQPFYPQTSLITPNAIKNSIVDFRATSRSIGDFPSLNMESIPYGVLNFEWGQANGEIECQQIYSTGLLYDSIDVLRVDQRGKHIWISSITGKIYSVLKAARQFYNLVGYQGGLDGYISLSNVEQAIIHSITPQRWNRFPSDARKCLLSNYKWELEKIDTALLNNDKEFQKYFIEKIKEIYWHLGYEADRDDLYIDYLKENGWYIE